MGTSEKLNSVTCRKKDHPHACGDKKIQSLNICVASGSSPRVWGQDNKFIINHFAEGIIPTRVGTSIVTVNLCFKFGDHPHACGDKHGLKSADRYLRGSSPRVWGQEYYSRSLDTAARIIPTRVGTRSILYFIRLVSLGSSPRVWGQVYKIL